MLLSREFIGYKELFVGCIDSDRLYCAADQVYHVLCSSIYLGQCMQAVYDARLMATIPYIDFRDIRFGEGARPVTDRHNFKEVIQDFGDSLLKLPNVAHALKTGQVFYDKVGGVGHPSASYKKILTNALVQLDEDDVNHRDLLRFYLGLDNIPDEKMFNLL
jgi:hypothetical protein